MANYTATHPRPHAHPLSHPTRFSFAFMQMLLDHRRMEGGGGVGVVTLGLLLLLLYGLLEFLVQIVIEIDKPKVAR